MVTSELKELDCVVLTGDKCANHRHEIPRHFERIVLTVQSHKRLIVSQSLEYVHKTFLSYLVLTQDYLLETCVSFQDVSHLTTSPILKHISV